MSNQDHILRHHYPDFFGKDSIASGKKTWFYKADVFPVCVIVVVFLWLAWSSGHIEPVRRINELRSQIDKTNDYFDIRAKKTVSLIDEIRKKLESNELNELNVASSSSRILRGDRISAIDSLNQIEKAIARLTLNKPNDEAIETRLKAAIEFAELSQQIVGRRDLQQYDLSFSLAGNEKKSDAPQGETDEEKSVTESLTGMFDKFDLAGGSEASNLIEQGKRSIQQAEQFLDPLNEPESRAKALLEKFDGLVMPRRQHELLRHINQEWNTQYFSLLENWKSVRTLEITIDEAIKKRDDQLAEREAKVAESEARERARLQNKAPIESATPKPETRQTNTRQRVVTPKPKPRAKTARERREEKRKKAQDLLN